MQLRDGSEIATILNEFNPVKFREKEKFSLLSLVYVLKKNFPTENFTS